MIQPLLIYHNKSFHAIVVLILQVHKICMSVLSMVRI